jgi:hypothetical protein
MTHPLTDKMCGDIAENLPDYNAETCMRAAADWQLEQVIEWLEYYPIKDVLDTGGYSALIKDFKEAMRPQEDNQ